MQVDVSFTRWQQLTARLEDEKDTYDALIGRLLGNPTEKIAAELRTDETAGAYYKGVFLPDGTKLRASYKGSTFFASIRDGRWIDETSGKARTSPSQAAYSITGSGVNGWLFWSARRPQDAEWVSLAALRSGNNA